MDTELRHKKLLDAARVIFELEQERESLNARRLELDLKLAEVEERLQEANDGHRALIDPLTEESPTNRNDGGRGPSVRKLILQYVAINEPVDQNDVIDDVVSKHGRARSTTRQAAYDLTSTKVGWLERTDDGLKLTDAGRAELGPVTAFAEPARKPV